MGGNESSDKQKDLIVNDNIKDMFKTSMYKGSGYPETNKDDYRFGECDFIEVSYDRIIVRKRIKAKDDRQFITYLKNKKERTIFDQNLFVKLLDYDSGALSYDESDDGTYKYFIDCYFEYHENDLRKEVKRRRSDGETFSAHELKDFIDFFIKAGTVLDSINSRHSDLRPEFICLSSEGRPLLMDNVRDKAGAGARLAFVSDMDKYMAPILYKHYCRNVMKIKHDKPKDDVFSAGLIVLEAGLLDSIQKMFDPDQAKLKTTILAEYMERFEERYSSNPDLVQTLKSMLTCEETDRPLFKEIKLFSGQFAQGSSSKQAQAKYASPSGNQTGQRSSSQSGNPTAQKGGQQGQVGARPQRPSYGSGSNPLTSGLGNSNANPISHQRPSYNTSPLNGGVGASNANIGVQKPAGYGTTPTGYGAKPTSGYGTSQPSQGQGANPLASSIANKPPGYGTSGNAGAQSGYGNPRLPPNRYAANPLSSQLGQK